MELRDILKKMMTRRKMTQADVAEAAGFKNQSNVSMILKSGNRMKIENLLRMTEALNCDLVIRDNESGELFAIEE